MERQTAVSDAAGGGRSERTSVFVGENLPVFSQKIRNLSANFVCVFLNMTEDDSPFFDHDMPTMRSSSSSSEGLPHVIGLNWEGSVESNEVNRRACSLDANCVRQCLVINSCIFLHQDSDQCKKSSIRRVNKGHHSKGKTRHGNSDGAHSSRTSNCGAGLPLSYTGPKACLCLFRFQYVYSDFLEFLARTKISSSCRIWQSSWSKSASRSIFRYLKSKT